MARLFGAMPNLPDNHTLVNGGLYVVKNGGLSHLGKFAGQESFFIIFLRTDALKGVKTAFPIPPPGTSVTI